MRSARCFGMYLSGAVKRGVVAPVDAELDPVGWAHSEQNLAVGESGAPQLAHAHARGAAHSSQNFAPGWLSCWHRGQFIRGPPLGGGRMATVDFSTRERWPDSSVGDRKGQH